MNWFIGSVEEAVAEAKKRNSYFVVYVEGDDPYSEMMTSILNSKDVCTILESIDYVSIRVKVHSDEYHQFLRIYQQVPVPSFFLIGLNGSPISIISNTSNEDRKSLRRQIIKSLISKQSNLQDITSTTGSETVSERTDINIGRLDSVFSEPFTMSSETTTKEETPMPDSFEFKKSSSAFIFKIPLSGQKDVNEKEQQTKTEDLRTSNVEVRRRPDTNEDPRLQEIQQEKDRNYKDRLRILNDIEIDKQERISRRQEEATIGPNSSNNLPKGNNIQMTSLAYDQACIQFRKPDGSQCTGIFNTQNVINDLRTYVIQNVYTTSRNFELGTPLPRHVFTENESSKTLEELHLVPNAVIIIIPSDDVGAFAYVYSQVANTLWYATYPFVSLYNFIRITLFSVPPPQISGGILRSASAAETLPNNRNHSLRLRKPSQVTSLSQGNVHTISSLHNDRDKDRNNVWNGNSTQQSQ